MKLNQFLLAGLLLTAGSAFAQGAGDTGGMDSGSDAGMSGGTMGGSTGSTMDSTGTMGADSQAFTDLDSNMDRSEEHTSELQSREKLVCRLLLEKKKLKNKLSCK